MASQHPLSARSLFLQDPCAFFESEGKPPSLAWDRREVKKGDKCWKESKLDACVQDNDGDVDYGTLIL